jgi:g-D-glutamyl-meso-diaminopimelate peptidase
MIIDFNRKDYSYEDLVLDADILTNTYKNIISNVTIGKSHDNRDIVMLRLGVGKKHILFCGGVHGRETVNPIVLLKIAEYYACHYEDCIKIRESRETPDDVLCDEELYELILFKKCVHELLHTYTILIIPLLNPDGYMISLYGYEAVKNQALRNRIKGMGIKHFEWKYNSRGVDINRNFPSRLWKPKGKADYAASENETKALIQVFHQYRIKCFLDFHSRGKSIYYYRSAMSGEYNDKQLHIAKRLAHVTKYELNDSRNEIEPDDSGGNTVHYFSERFNKPALTIETVDENAAFPLDYKYRAITFDELKLVPLELGGVQL